MMPLNDRDRPGRETRTSPRGVPAPPLASLLERIGFYALLIVIFLSAVPFGTVDPFFKSLFVISISAVAIVRIVQHVAGTPVRFAEPIMLSPLVGILLLAMLQTVPLPWLDGKPLSWDPYETKIFAVSFAGLLMACELLFFYTYTRRRLWFVILLVLLTGAASAVFGILCTLLGIDSVAIMSAYIFTGLSTESQGYAQFINRNHFAVLMEMAVGLTVGLLLKGRWSQGEKLVGWVLVALFILAAISANSRGGLISVAAIGVLAAFVHVMTMTKRPSKNDGPATSRIWPRALIATLVSCFVFGAFVFTVAFVGGDAVVHRIEQLPREVQVPQQQGMNRLTIWQATWLMIKEEPLTGVGFGAYETAFPAFDRSGGKWVAQQAHNDYLEVLANGGVGAFALFAIFAVIVIRRGLRNFASPDPLVRSSCFGALIGMFGVMLHSVADFGLHVMINALIFAVLIVIATARITDRITYR